MSAQVYRDAIASEFLSHATPATVDAVKARRARIVKVTGEAPGDIVDALGHVAHGKDGKRANAVDFDRKVKRRLGARFLSNAVSGDIRDNAMMLRQGKNAKREQAKRAVRTFDRKADRLTALKIELSESMPGGKIFNRCKSSAQKRALRSRCHHIRTMIADNSF